MERKTLSTIESIVGTEFINEDIEEIMENTSSRLDLLMFPKVNSGEEVLKLDELVTAYESKFKRKKK